jgi:NitT/TauT family transport system substrate-binding protein
MGTAQRLLGRRDFLQALGMGVGGAVVLGACRGGSGSRGRTEGGRFTGEVAVAHLESTITAAPFLVAEQLGYFTAENLDLDLVSFPGGTDTIRGIATGIPFGMPATLPGLIAFQKGQRTLRLVSGTYNAASVNFVVPVDSDIRSVEGLQGKKIAVSQPGSITTYFATRIAKEQGLVPGKTVELLNVGSAPDAWAATKQGVADVAWSIPPTSDKLIAKREARLLFETSDYVTDWVDTTCWARQDFIDKSPDVVRAILRALQKTFTTIRDDLDTAAPAYAKRAKLDEAVARGVLKKAGPVMGLKLDMPGIEANVKAGVELGQLDASIDLKKVIFSDFVNEL